jgi:hypothetical protein
MRSLGTLVGCCCGVIIVVARLSEFVLTIWRFSAAILATGVASLASGRPAYAAFLALFVTDIVVLCRYVVTDGTDVADHNNVTVRLALWRGGLNLTGSSVALLMSSLWPLSSAKMARRDLAVASRCMSLGLGLLADGFIQGPGTTLPHMDMPAIARTLATARSRITSARANGSAPGVRSGIKAAVDNFDKVLTITRAALLRVSGEIAVSVESGGTNYTDAAHTVYVRCLENDIRDVVDNVRHRLEHLAICLATDTAPEPIAQHPVEERAIERVKAGFHELRRQRYAQVPRPDLLPINDIIRFASFIHLLTRLVQQIHDTHDCVNAITRRRIHEGLV